MSGAGGSLELAGCALGAPRAAGWSLLRLLPVPAGIDQFCQDIRDMICHCPPWCSHMLGYFKLCWVFFTPCLLLVSIGRSPEAEG